MADPDLGRLCAAIPSARLTLRRYRQERADMIRHFVGQHWSDHGSSAKVPVNFLALYCDIVGPSLISKEPRVDLTTFDRAHQPMLSAAKDWINMEIERKHVAMVLQRCGMDSFFSLGIMKVALATPADAATMAWRLKAGEPFAECVDLDDFVYDVHAHDFAEVSFIGHRFRAPLDAVRDSPIYGRARTQVTPTYDEYYNPEGDERPSTIGRGFYTSMENEFEDFTTLWEIYLPRHRLVVTLADQHLGGPSLMGPNFEPLRVQRWLGPDVGPYHMLGLQTVPGNAMPKAPLQDLFDLSELANNTWRKLNRQADRQKEVLAVAGQAMEDAARINAASDGEACQVNAPERLKNLLFGGPNQGMMQMWMQTWEVFNRMAGNLEMQGGLSPQSKTLGQDQLLAANASRLVADKQQSMIRFTSEVVKAMIWYWWHDPMRIMSSRYNVPGLPEIGLMRHVHPQQRQQLPFDQIDVKVDPYSLTHRTPDQKLQALNGLIQSVAPMMGLWQQQGVSLDANAYVRMAAEFMDMPEINDLFIHQEPPEQDSQTGGAQAPTMPASTTRNYTRRSVGGASRYGKDIGIMNAMKPQTNGVQEPAEAGG